MSDAAIMEKPDPEDAQADESAGEQDGAGEDAGDGAGNDAGDGAGENGDAAGE